MFAQIPMIIAPTHDIVSRLAHGRESDAALLEILGKAGLVPGFRRFECPDQPRRAPDEPPVPGVAWDLAQPFALQFGLGDLLIIRDFTACLKQLVESSQGDRGFKSLRLRQ